MARFVVDLRLYLERERERESYECVYIKLKNKEKHYSTFRGSKKGKAFSEIRCVLYKRAFQFSLIFTLAPLFFSSDRFVLPFRDILDVCVSLGS